MTKEQLLQEFYAVTLTSVYKVNGETPQSPIIEKIAIHPNNTEKTAPIGFCIKNGTRVAIEKKLAVYTPSGLSSRPDYVSILGYAGRTSLIVALFLDKERALECSRTLADPKSCDPRWWSETKAVLDAMGNDHPVFVQPEDSDFRLSPITILSR